MNKKPILGLLNETHNNYKKLKIIDLQNPFLPIMDNKGKLREILIGQKFSQSISTALILAGGRGS